MFFMGTYTPKLDEKGRLFLPAKFRDRLAEGLVVTQGQENCLVVWPTDVFMEEARRAQATPMTVRGARDYARVLFAGADEGSLDKQGRIGIPATLREYAGLDRDVVVIGSWTASRSGTRPAGGSTPPARRRSSPSWTSNRPRPN